MSQKIRIWVKRVDLGEKIQAGQIQQIVKGWVSANISLDISLPPNVYCYLRVISISSVANLSHAVFTTRPIACR